MTAITIDCKTSENSKLFLLLVDDFSKILFNFFESFLLCIALIDEVLLLLHKDCCGMSDINDSSMSDIDAGSLREILSLRVLAVKLR